MKIIELKTSLNTAYLYEGLTPAHKNSVMLWESAGRAIVEAQLTNAQIQQLFQKVEQDLTSLGKNRTTVGQAKDAGSAVAQAYKDLKAKVTNSGPIKNIDAMYDQAAAKLKQATGGDQGVMQYIEKYRTFAKKHPIAQSLIYGALIAAAGISGAGAGGAAALGLFKMVDKLLQGEKFSKAAIAGAETGALAYGASKLGDLVKNAFNPTSGTREISWETTGGGISQANIGPGGKVVGDVMLNGQTFTPGSPGYAEAAKELVNTAKADGLLGGFGDAADAAKAAAHKAVAGSTFESVRLSNEQVTALFETIVIEAGLWDQFKSGIGQAAGAAAQGLSQQTQRIGHNITTKTTADKLQKAWKAAGMPTDSVEIGKILRDAGVDTTVIKSAMQSIGVEPSINAQSVTSSKLPDITKLTLDQKQRLLAVLDQLDKTATT